MSNQRVPSVPKSAMQDGFATGGGGAFFRRRCGRGRYGIYGWLLVRWAYTTFKIMKCIYCGNRRYSMQTVTTPGRPRT